MRLIAPGAGGSAPSVKRNLVANYAGQVLTAAFGLVFVPVYVGLLGMEAYGLIGLFAVLQAWLALLDFGMTPTLNREMARYSSGEYDHCSVRDLLRTMEVLALLVAVATALVVLVGAPPVASDWLNLRAVSRSTAIDAIVLMGIVVALRLIEGIYRGALLGLQRQVLYNVANTSLALLRHGGAAAVLLWVSPTIIAFFLWQVFVSFLSIVILAFAVYARLPSPPRSANFSWSVVKSIRAFAGSMMIITLLSLLLTQTDKLILSKLVSLAEFGTYALAATVVSALYFLVSPITQAIYPRMVELVSEGDTERLAELYHQGSQLVAVIVVPAAALLVAFSEGLMFAWSGDPALAANVAPILSALALGTAIHALMWVPYHLQLANGWTSLAITTNAIALAALGPALLWAVPRFGAIGAAWIWVALNIFYGLFGIQAMHRRLLTTEKRQWYLVDNGLPIAAVGAAIAIASLVAPGETAGRLEWFLFLAIAGAMSVCGAMLCAGRTRRRALALVEGLTRRPAPGA